MKYSEDIIQQYRLKLSLNPTIYELQLEQKLLSWRIPYEKQKPIIANNKLYFLDFFLPTYNTYIEVDGKYHNTYKQSKLDSRRQLYISLDHNFKELRIPNKSITNLTKQNLIQLINQPTQQPNPPKKYKKKKKITVNLSPAADN